MGLRASRVDTLAIWGPTRAGSAGAWAPFGAFDGGEDCIRVWNDWLGDMARWTGDVARGTDEAESVLRFEGEATMPVLVR